MMRPVKKLFSYLVAQRSHLSKFIFVGMLTFFVNISLFHLLYGQLFIDYRFSVSISWIMTVILHFNMNRIFTFRAGEFNIIKHTRRYVLMLGFNYFMTMIVVWATVHVLGSPYVGIVISTGLTAVSSFFAMRYYVFLQQVKGCNVRG